MTRKLQPEWEKAALYLSFGAAASGVVSIAACHTVLALAFVALLASGRLRLPPVWLPAALFLAATAASLALSEEPAAGLPQIRKFYVFLMLVVVYSGIRSLTWAGRLLVAIIGAATVSALWSMVQFYQKYERAMELGQPFYQAYVADRITGFMSHWMTFSGQMMIAFLLLAAFLFFSRRWNQRLPLSLLCGAGLAAALVLGFTRSIWPATAVGALYLVWHWRRWAILAAPLALGIGLWVAPEPVSTRVLSIWKPDRQLDSNLHREVLRQTGLRMAAAHPWFGVGPEQVQRNFVAYLPPDAPKPVPDNWWYGHLHNIYVHYAAERGVPALLALLVMIGKALADFVRALRRLPAGRSEQRFVLQAAIAVIAGILVGGWWELNLGDSEVLGLFLAMIACGYIAAESPPELEHG